MFASEEDCASGKDEKQMYKDESSFQVDRHENVKYYSEEQHHNVSG